ncbi:hypothetical protein POJ06DRAFT_244736 [Lipomyces tetrasporus]|uniref:mRNA 3'-end-processing protein RNA14 n=1 Tax=Lipomyces tetrasporus TaxID=54092 RepID=A0AAD7QW21_9ASCO|nr:uncharacterized protein POJ06DRAFT_244736 [Lipomyces tetrasporus]KAJ8102479.1 hypothetical protein POJ06DRAFT_244736 [Lipomyces tetrasporus]
MTDGALSYAEPVPSDDDTGLPGYISPVDDNEEDATPPEAGDEYVPSPVPEAESNGVTITMDLIDKLLPPVPEEAAHTSDSMPEPEPEPPEEDDEESSSEDETASTTSTASTPSVEDLEPVPVAAPRRKRLPKDTIGHLEDRIAHDGIHAPLTLYNDLIAEYVKRGKIDSARDGYERSLKLYPTVASQWIAYADMEQSAGEFTKAEEVYRRAVEAVTSLLIWEHYLTYVRRRNNVITDGETARRAIIQAFEVVASKVGIDVRSGKVWKDYIDFIKSSPDGQSTWETQQKMDLLRKVFQRVVCIPVENLENLWQDYNLFENSLNKTTARKFLADRAPAYMTARSCLKELQQTSSTLDRDLIPVRPRWRESELGQLALWNRWISWELTDPLGFTSEDGKGGVPGGKEQLIERVLYAYRQALQPLRFYPQIWFDASEYCASVDMPDLQLSFLRDGAAANPGSSLLHFRLAEVYELTKKREDAKKTYQSLAASIIKEIKMAEEICEEKKNALQSREETKSIYSTTDGKPKDDDDEEQVLDNKRDHGLELKIKRVEEKGQERLAELSKDLTLCNTMYMRAMKRMEGLKAARQVFSEARKLPYSTHHIFVASALMEYHHNKGPEIASKIFEIGLRRFVDTVAFVEQYLDFLIMTNDDTNARALFERTASKLSAKDARPLFHKFYAYEAAYGSELSAVARLESRMCELYPDAKPIARFAGRYTLGEHSVIGEREVGPLVYKDILKEEQGISSASLIAEDNFEEDIVTAVPVMAPEPTKSTVKSKRAQKRARTEATGESRKRIRKKEKEKPEPRGTSSNAQQRDPFIGNTNTLPDGVMRLLSLLPPASTYKAVLFDPDALVNLIDHTRIPAVPPPNANLSRFKPG